MNLEWVRKLFQPKDPKELHDELNADKYIGGTIRDGSDDEKFVFGNMEFDINKAREISKGQANGTVAASGKWSNRIHVDAEYAMKGKSQNPVMIAQIETTNGIKPLLIDGHHRMYKAVQEGKKELPAFIFSPEQTKQLMDVPSDMEDKVGKDVAEPPSVQNPNTILDDDLDDTGKVVESAMKDQPCGADVHVAAPMGKKINPPIQKELEFGSHMHNLIRQDAETDSDGAHRHFYILPTGETVWTDVGGEHVHPLSDEAANSTDFGGAHVHSITIDGVQMYTEEDGRHEHENNLDSTAFDGNHVHGLVLPAYGLIFTPTAGEYYDSEADSEVKESGWPDPANMPTESQSGTGNDLKNDEPTFTPLKLDLGSGKEREPDHLGIDLFPHDEATMVHDLSLGIPLPDESASHVRMVNSLHEMEDVDPKAIMAEIQRVLMPGGQFHYEGPNQIYNDQPNMEERENNVTKDNNSPWYVQDYAKIATPDAATSNDSEPRVGIPNYDDLPSDALLAMDALGYYYSDATTSGKGNRLHGYPSQGALIPEGTRRGNFVRDPGNVNKKKLHDETGASAPGAIGAAIAGAGSGAMGKAKLGYSQRQRLADTTFALPEERKYPIQDISHARNALARVAQHGTSDEQKKVRAAVYRKFPSLKPTEKFAKIFKSEDWKHLVYCVVLEPDTEDAQGDVMTADEIEKAAHYYLKEAGAIGSRHVKGIKDAYPVESYIAPQDIKIDGQYGSQVVKKGSWVIGILVEDPDEWAKIVSGETTGVSVGGFGQRD